MGGGEPGNRTGATWHIAVRPGKRRLLDAESAVAMTERGKALLPARMVIPFRGMKRQFGYVNMRYR